MWIYRSEMHRQRKKCSFHEFHGIQLPQYWWDPLMTSIAMGSIGDVRLFHYTPQGEKNVIQKHAQNPRVFEKMS
jgi:hypothetical protein